MFEKWRSLVYYMNNPASNKRYETIRTLLYVGRSVCVPLYHRIPFPPSRLELRGISRWAVVSIGLIIPSPPPVHHAFDFCIAHEEVQHSPRSSPALSGGGSSCTIMSCIMKRLSALRLPLVPEEDMEKSNEVCAFLQLWESKPPTCIHSENRVGYGTTTVVYVTPYPE